MNFISLMKAEWFKLAHYRAFWLITGIFAFSFVMGCYIASDFTSSLDVNGSPIDISRLVKFPAVWKSFSWFASFFFYLLACLVALVICNEFENKTLRQHVIDGLNRFEVVLGKWLIVSLFVVMVSLLVMISAALFGEGTITKTWIDGMSRLGPLFLGGLGHLTFVMMIAVFIKRAALTIIIATLYPIIIEPIQWWILKSQDLEGVANHLPFEAFSNLTPFPVSADAIGLSLSSTPYAVPVSIVYILAFFGISIIRVKTMDL